MLRPAKNDSSRETEDDLYLGHGKHNLLGHDLCGTSESSELQNEAIEQKKKKNHANERESINNEDLSRRNRKWLRRRDADRGGRTRYLAPMESPTPPPIVTP
jgi:hypothetical protein